MHYIHKRAKKSSSSAVGQKKTKTNVRKPTAANKVSCRLTNMWVCLQYGRRVMQYEVSPFANDIIRYVRGSESCFTVSTNKDTPAASLAIAVMRRSENIWMSKSQRRTKMMILPRKAERSYPMTSFWFRPTCTYKGTATPPNPWPISPAAYV